MSLNNTKTGQRCPDCGSPLKPEELDPPVCDDCVEIRLLKACRENDLARRDTRCNDD